MTLGAGMEEGEEEEVRKEVYVSNMTVVALHSSCMSAFRSLQCSCFSLF